MPEVSQYSIANLGQRRRVRRLNVLNGENNVSAVSAERGAQIARAQAENIVQDCGRVPKFWKRLIRFDKFCLAGHKIELLGQFVDRDAAAAPDFLGNLPGKGFAKLFGLLLLQLRLDGGFHLVEGLRAGCLPIDDLYDVEAILGLN